MYLGENFYGNKGRWFRITEDNVKNIENQGYFGKEIQVGYYAARVGGDEKHDDFCMSGYEVISDEEYRKAYNVPVMEESLERE